MLHGIINEQGNILDVRCDISEKKLYFHMCSYESLYKFLIISPWTCVTDVINKLFIPYFLMRIILKYIGIQIENNSLTYKRYNLINVPVKCKYSILNL